MRTQLISLLALAAITVHAHTAPVFGGFDSTRGGVSDINGPSWSDLRNNLATTFMGTFSSTATITTAYLDSIDILLLGVAADGTTPVSSLSAAEQSAVYSFVQAGGGAIFFLDNNIQFESISDSIAAPFGLDTTGAIPGSASSTITAPTHPVADGPFGMVSNFSHSSFPGWFASLGPNAASVASLDVNGQTSLAAIAPGQLGAGSGGVVLFSDSVELSGNFNGNVATLVDNAVAFLLFQDIPDVDLRLCGLEYDRETGLGHVTLKGTPRTDYILVKSTDLDFSARNRIPLLSAVVGEVASDVLTTNNEGTATVEINLGLGPRLFLRGETP